MLKEAIQNGGVILCPQCHSDNVTIIQAELHEGGVHGQCSCLNCEIVEPKPLERPFNRFPRREITQLLIQPTPEYKHKPLDFAFSCDILVVRTWSRHLAEDYEYHINIKFNDNDDDTMTKLYIIRHKEANNLITGVFTTYKGAISAQGNTDKLEMVTCGQYRLPKTESFPVWTVSVGKGTSYRLIDIFTDRKLAAKVASSVHAELRQFEAVPERRRPTTVEVWKSWVILNLHDSRDRASIIDCIGWRKRIHPGEQSTLLPIATLRRPYDSSLPHRVEVLAERESISLKIAQDLSQMSDTEIAEIMDYNVDYQLIHDVNTCTWKIDPDLLNQPE